MLLDKLYTQFQKGDRLLFGSRLLNALGRTFIGSPKDLGIEIARADLEQGFYLIPIDRKPPESRADFDHWSKSAREPNLKRHALHPHVARGTFYAVVIVVLAMGTATGLVHTAKKGVAKAGSAVSGAFSESSDTGASNDLAKCQQLDAQIRSGAVAMDTIPRATLERCVELLKGGQ